MLPGQLLIPAEPFFLLKIQGFFPFFQGLIQILQAFLFCRFGSNRMMELVQVIFLLLQFQVVTIQGFRFSCLLPKFLVQAFGRQPGFFRHGLNLLIQGL